MISYLKSIFLLSIVLIIVNVGNAQNIHTEIGIELCNCLELNNIKKASEMDPCFDNLIQKNIDNIKRHYNVNEYSEINFEELFAKIGVYIMNNCDYVIDTFPQGVVGSDKNIVKQTDLNCSDKLVGEYYYLTKRPDNEKIMDTTFVSITKDKFLEKMKSRNSYSLLNIIWTDDCKFDLEFIESDDFFKKEMSKPGDLYNYEVIAKQDNSIFLKLYWNKREYQLELVKFN